MKLVVCTPAGRRDRMACLAAYVLRDSFVDRWDVWVNTRDHYDLEYLHRLAAHPKVRLVEVPDPVPDRVAYRIHKFYPHASDPGTVYVRLDDDIVWYAPHAVWDLALHRRADPVPFLVYGNVLNSGLTTFAHQQAGRIPREWGVVGDDCMDPVGWHSGDFAVKLHEAFLADPRPERWMLPDRLLSDYKRHSINAISWLGSDCAEWAGRMSDDEEAWLAHEEPKRSGRPNLIAGDCLFAHLSFYTQHEAVEKAGILSRYKLLAGITS